MSLTVQTPVHNPASLPLQGSMLCCGMAVSAVQMYQLAWQMAAAQHAAQQRNTYAAGLARLRLLALSN